MEFGKLSQVNHINFQLPADNSISLRYLNQIKNDQPTEFRLGAPLWGAKDWLGVIYPKGTKSTDYLHHYAQNFSCIELNTTHYRIPTDSQVKQWLSQVSPNFLFCPKVLQAISHETLLDANLLKSWFTFLENISPNLGPCFLQFPPNFTYHQKFLLHQFLQRWPAEFKLTLEFRHPSWFQGHEILPALTEFLQQKEIGLVITDVAGRRDVLHTSISAPFMMLRLICNNGHESDLTRINDWADKLRGWRDAGLQQAFIFIHQPVDLQVPDTVDLTAKIFNEKIGTRLPKTHRLNWLA